MFRTPKTTNEARQTALMEEELKEEYDLRIRGKRRAKNLPDEWWDQYRSNVLSKSWKNRKARKQYQRHAA